MKKVLYIAVGIPAALLVAGMVTTACVWPPINDVETGTTPEYPDIQPHYYSTEPLRIYEEALAAVESMERWEVVDRRRSERTLEATRTTRVLGFVDEVTIRVEPVTEFVSQVEVRSRSRVGSVDFGQNARNIRQFFEELDDRLGAVKFEPDRQDPTDVEEQQVGEG